MMTSTPCWTSRAAWRARPTRPKTFIPPAAAASALDARAGRARAADRAENLHPARMRGLDDERRAAQAGDEDRSFLFQDHVELRARNLLIEPAPLVQVLGALGSRDVVLFLDHLRVGAMLIGD